MKAISLSAFELNVRQIMIGCADSGEPLLVELPDHRLVALQPVPTDADESVIDDLLASNAAFQSLVEKSQAGRRKSFVPATRK
jgi:hypothetical protein